MRLVLSLLLFLLGAMFCVCVCVACSEFTGCGRVLVGAIPVNPWQQEQMVAAIHHALTMPDMERAARYETNMEVCDRVVAVALWPWYCLPCDSVCVTGVCAPCASSAGGDGEHDLTVGGAHAAGPEASVHRSAGAAV